MMAQQGAALQTYNNELVKSLEELVRRRQALQAQIDGEAQEKRRLEGERARVQQYLQAGGYITYILTRNFNSSLF